jgi:basic membrane lipoprotein Med (substrate-binding protein (PBP1-ABC) superfamily)
MAALVRVLPAAALVLAMGCQAFVNSDAAGGIGAPCAKDSDCQASECTGGVCTLECSKPADCPEGTTCTSAKLCQLTLRAAWIHPGNPADEQWTLAHEIGRADAAALSVVTELKPFLDAKTPTDAAAAVDQAVAEGFKVVIATSPDFATTIADKAAQYPTTQFLTCGSRVTGPNHGSYYGRIYKAWWLAGKAAALKTVKKRLGMVGSFITPSVVQNINAFTRGAQAVDPLIVVEVRWVKEWQDVFTDKSKFVVLTDELFDTGCDVIAHQGFKGFPVLELEKAPFAGAFSIGNNVRTACDNANRCLGAVWWNWGPLYRQMLADYHAGGLPPGAAYYADIQVDPDDSVFGFTTTDPALQGQLGADLATLAGEGGVGTPFAGDFCSTEVPMPRCFNAMTPVTDDVLRAMCFFVTGVVEKEDAADPMSLDKDAQVPPEGDCTPPPPM